MRTKHLQILRKQEINGPLFGNTAAIPNIFGFYRRTSFSCKSNVCFLCAFLLVVVFWMKFNMFIKSVVSLFKMRWHELQCEDNGLSFFIIFLIIIQRHTDVTKRIVWQLYQCKEKNLTIQAWLYRCYNHAYMHMVSIAIFTFIFISFSIITLHFISFSVYIVRYAINWTYASAFF